VTLYYFVGGFLAGAVLRSRADQVATFSHPLVVEGEIVVGGAVAVREAERIVYRAAH